MNELNEKIQRRFRDNIAIAQVKEELYMKKLEKKKIFMATLVCMLLVSGTFFTANAMTDGELINNIKEAIVIKLTDMGITINGQTVKVNEEFDEKGNRVSVKYSFENQARDYCYEVLEK